MTPPMNPNSSRYSDDALDETNSDVVRCPHGVALDRIREDEHACERCWDDFTWYVRDEGAR